MTAHNRYRHPHCLDIDIYIVKIQYRGPRYIKARVLYWNRNYKGVVFPTPKTVKIKLVDIPKWKWVNDATI